jgi:alkylation response protein AidB-like acyl-CoA dehydrogenase
MIDYRTSLADIVLTIEHVAGAGRLPDWEPGTAAEILAHAARFVDEVIAPLDPIGDQQGVRMDQGRARMPAAFRAAYDAFREAGWTALAADPAYGGQGLPHILAGALSEMLSGACVSYQMVLSLGQGAMRTIALNGSEAQKARILPKLASGEWLATMCLTEATAGSDLGQVRTVAVPDGDGWALTGGKIFISGGDQDFTDTIVHLVLARTGEPGSGVKGLSLFLAPSVLPDGRRNAITLLRLEEKMGMHASPTCQLAFDGAWAEMIGAPGEGLARMFTMMNFERLDVALQGVGLADCAGQRSRAYAAGRRQGRALGHDGAAPITAHDDVRRMLMIQRALALGIRAMTYRTLVDLELDPASPLVEFMTPVCKAFATDAAITAAQAAIQVHGGYGYLREYRVEQILRDARITQIYEGTNGIQAMTLAGRLLRIQGGAPARAFDDAVTAACAGAGPDLAAALAEALAQWRGASRVVGALPSVGSVADAYLRLTGLVAFGAAWARLEAAADHAADPPGLRALARFVAEWMLPETAHLARLCAAPVDLARLPDSVFAEV